MTGLLIFGALALLVAGAAGKAKTLLKLEFGTAGIKESKTKTGLNNCLIHEYWLVYHCRFAANTG